MKRLALFVLISSITACSQHASSPSTKAEPLYGIKTHPQKVELWVRSNGCTKSRDFHVELTKNGDKQWLEAVRKKPDLCRKKTSIVKIKLALPTSLSNNRVFWMNPTGIPSKAWRREK